MWYLWDADLVAGAECALHTPADLLPDNTWSTKQEVIQKYARQFTVDTPDPEVQP